ncbi:hypothetical protein FF1_033141 [Malus domestica]
MIVWTLDAKQDPFRPKKDEEEILELEVPYLSAIGALLYLAQCTRLDISFVVNILVRYNNAPTCKHWNGVKDIFFYLKGTTDLGLFYTHQFSSVATPCGSRIDYRLVATQMLDICLTHIKHVLKRVMSLPLETLPYLGGLPSKR